MIRFAQPLVLLLLLAILPLAVVLWKQRGRQTPRMVFSSIKVAPTEGGRLRVALRRLPHMLVLIALTLLIIAMARPQTAMRERNRMTEGIDIMLVIDVSESMRAMDFEPNRLEKAKEVVSEFIQGRMDDRIGVVIFGRETFALCPLTRDYATVQSFVERIDFDLVDGDGTAIGMGLANAVNKLKDSAAKSKVVILLTDGENNFGEIQPSTAAEIAKQLEVRAYTIGIGSEGYVDMPQRTLGGGWIVTSQLSHIDTIALEYIADHTGGRFFMATDGTKLEEIYREIDELERTEIEVTEMNLFDELAHLLILPAALLLAGAFLIEEGWLLSFP